MSEPLDERFMARAIEIAAAGHTAPNPRVGAVITSPEADTEDHEIVAVGHHEGPGQAHAEVVALRAAGARARGATLHCTLEPCNHHGRTPPCTEAVIAAGIRRVVIGARDPKAYATGPGLDRLRAAGIEVEVGVLAAECEALIEDFTCLVRNARPLVIAKSAVTLDGRIATQTGDSKWITGELAREQAHRMRDRADAVLVGVETVLADDPSLTVRMVTGRDPMRIVLDTHLRTNADAKLLHHSSRAKTLIIHGPQAPMDKRAALSNLAGVELLELPLGVAGRIDLSALLSELGRREVMQLLVEGGGVLIGALLDAGLVDRLAVFIAPMVLGDPAGRPLAHRASPVHNLSEASRLHDVRIRTFGDDVLVEGRLPFKS